MASMTALSKASASRWLNDPSKTATRPKLGRRTQPGATLRRHPSAKAVAIDLAELVELDLADLRHRWHDAFGIEPLARLSREVLVAALSHHAQEVDSIAEFGRRDGIARTIVSHQLPLAFLAPDITEAVVEGRQPLGPTLEGLITLAAASPRLACPHSVAQFKSNAWWA